VARARERGVGRRRRREVIAEVSQDDRRPAQPLEKAEAERLLKMEAELHKKVISQDDAIKAIAKAVRRSRAGLKDPKRPMGSFIFLGPSGVGKTLLAKALAEFMFGDARTRSSTSTCPSTWRSTTPQPPGRRASGLRRLRGGRPAHREGPPPPVLGGAARRDREGPPRRLQHAPPDHGGRPPDRLVRPHVDFRNVILIMTSNIGANLIKGGGGFGFGKKRTGESDYDNIKTI
jgi:ATP-dependent Clp protease ATP-binding subunit ClpC